MTLLLRSTHNNLLKVLRFLHERLFLCSQLGTCKFLSDFLCNWLLRMKNTSFRERQILNLKLHFVSFHCRFCFSDLKASAPHQACSILLKTVNSQSWAKQCFQECPQLYSGRAAWTGECEDRRKDLLNLNQSWKWGKCHRRSLSRLSRQPNTLHLCTPAWRTCGCSSSRWSGLV